MSSKTFFYSVLIVGVIYFMFTVGFPLLLAFVIALLLEPLVQIICEKARLKRLFSSILICTAFTILFLVLSYFAIAKVSKEVSELITTLSASIGNNSSGWQDIVARITGLFSRIDPAFEDNIEQTAITISSSLQRLLVAAANSTINLAKALPGLIVDVVIFFIALYLFSIRLSALKPLLLNFFDPKSHDDINLVLTKLSQALFGFIRVQIVIFISVFLIIYAGFLILGIKYAAALAVFVAIVDILPILGVGSVLIPMSVYMFITGSIYLGIGLLILYVVTIALRHIITTKVMADNVGVGALSALISLYLGFQIAGLPGMFMGPVIVLLFQTLIKVGLIKIKFTFNN